MAPKRGTFVSEKDLSRFTTISDFITHRITRELASAMLGISERQVSRPARKVEKEGLIGLIHGNTGKIPGLVRSAASPWNRTKPFMRRREEYVSDARGVRT
jgi:hypothetical protein